MFEQVDVDNYQSIAHLSVPLAEFTVIVGPSGRGKSAFLRALTSLCFNQVGQKFVRHGQSKARVALTFDDGQVVEWKKPREGGATYTTDEQEYTRTGRSVPPDIEKLLGVRRIEVDKGLSWRPQFHLQFDPPLLLTESSTLAARALARLTKLQVLVEAQMECRRDKLRVGRQHTSAEEEVERLQGQLSELPNVRKARNVLERANKLLASIQERLATAKQADEIAQDITGALLLADVVPPSEEDMAALEKQMVFIETAVATIVESEACDENAAAAGDALEEAEVVLSGVEDSYAALVEELGACPLCGSTETWGHDHD